MIATACRPYWVDVNHPVSSPHLRWPPVVAEEGGGTHAALLIKHLPLQPATRLISGSDSHTSAYAYMFTHVPLHREKNSGAHTYPLKTGRQIVK